MGWLETTLNGLATQIKSKLSKKEADEIFQKKKDAFNGNYKDLKNKPKFAKIATSGEWADAENKPDVLRYILSFSGDIKYPTVDFHNMEKKWAISRNHETTNGICPLYCFTKENGLYEWNYSGEVSLIKKPPQGIENLEIQKLYVVNYTNINHQSECYVLTIKNSDQIFIAKNGEFYSSTLPLSVNLIELLRVDNSLLAIPQESDVIFKSDNFGETWSIVQFPQRISFDCYGLSYLYGSSFKAAIIFEKYQKDFFYSNDLINWEVFSLPSPVLGAYYSDVFINRKIILSKSQGYYFDAKTKEISSFALPDSPVEIIQGTEFGWYSRFDYDYKIFRGTSLIGISQEEPYGAYYLGEKYIKFDGSNGIPFLVVPKAYHYGGDAEIVFKENLAPLIINYNTSIAADFDNAVAAFRAGRQVLLKNYWHTIPMIDYGNECIFSGIIDENPSDGHVIIVYAHISPIREKCFWHEYEIATSAAGMHSEDAGDYFTSTNVMGQLQELGEKIKELSASIPTKTSQLENDSGFVSDKDTVESETANIPSKLSEFENDVGYLTLDTLPQT